MQIKFFLYVILFFCIFSNTVFAEEYRIKIVDYPKEILIERGWVKYFNAVVMNDGDLNLKNVTISFDGEFPQWFEVQTNETSLLQVNSNASFFVKLSVPSDAEAKIYSFIIYSKAKKLQAAKTLML